MKQWGWTVTAETHALHWLSQSAFRVTKIKAFWKLHVHLHITYTTANPKWPQISELLKNEGDVRECLDNMVCRHKEWEREKASSLDLKLPGFSSALCDLYFKLITAKWSTKPICHFVGVQEAVAYFYSDIQSLFPLCFYSTAVDTLGYTVFLVFLAWGVSLWAERILISI